MVSQLDSGWLTTFAALMGTAVAGVMAATPATAAPPAPASAVQAADRAEASEFITKGTSVTVRNDGDQTIWVRKWHWRTGFYWEAPMALTPGALASFAGNHCPGDDVELRVFFDQGKADDNEDGIDVDAENPAYAAPWLSVDWDSEYFSVGGTHTWVAHDGSRYWGQRESDSSAYKHFRLHVTNV